MLRLIAARLAQMVVVIILVTALAFALLNLLRGNVVDAILGDNYTPQAAATLRHELHLDQPLAERYVTWLGDALSGNLGTSLISHQSVAQAIGSALGPTVELMIGGQIVGILLAVITTALSLRSRWMRRIVTALAIIFNAMPSFLSGLLLIVIFATTLRMLPSVGWVSLADGGLTENLRAIALPSATLGLSIFPDYMRVFHAEIAEQLEREEYVLLARMKGLRGIRVMVVHVLRNAAGGMITLVAITTGFLLAGVVVVEQIFSIPGLGSLTLRAVNDRDSPMLQGAIVVIAAGVVVVNLIADLVQMKIDPRLRPTSRKRRRRIRGGVTPPTTGFAPGTPSVTLTQEGARG